MTCNLITSTLSKILMLVGQISVVAIFLRSHGFHFDSESGSSTLVLAEMLLSVTFHLTGEILSKVFFFNVKLSSFSFVMISKSFSSVLVILGHLVLGFGQEVVIVGLLIIVFLL